MEIGEEIVMKIEILQDDGVSEKVGGKMTELIMVERERVEGIEIGES